MRQESVETSATRLGCDLVADEYSAQLSDELTGKPLDRALLDMMVDLASSGVIGDIGGGPGHVASYLAHRGARVVGMDLSAAMCAAGQQATSLPFAVGEMTALPVRSQGLGAIVSLFAVIHLDASSRAAAYREFARVLRPGGYVLIAFHPADADTDPGGMKTLTQWWGYDVELNFRFLDPLTEIGSMAAAGLRVVARLDRAPYEGVEHQSQRSYLLAQRVPVGGAQMFESLL